MIKHVLLVAKREFKQIAAMRSFWLTLLFLPAALVLGPTVSKIVDPSETQRIMLIDPIGSSAQAIEKRIEADHQRRVLTALSRYAQRHELGRYEPNAPWAVHDRLFTDADVNAFLAAGGAPAALERMKRVGGPDVPPFKMPPTLLEVVPSDARLNGLEPRQLNQEIRALLDDEGKGEKLDYALHIPRDFGAGGSVASLWARDEINPTVLQPLQSVLTATLRARFLEVSGLDRTLAERAGTMTPSIAINVPGPGEGRERMFVRSILPLGSAYLLLMALLLSGSWMLQGVIEERSNKLIETVLACVSPNELLYGKLVGTVAVGLVMMLVWIACALVAAFATQGMAADLLRPALAPLANPEIAIAMIFFFLMGYLMVSLIFLAIGAVSDTVADAQAYLTPVILVIALPFMIIVPAIVQGTASSALTIMTWIPLLTPFTMLARLGVGVPIWEMVGAGTVLALFVFIQFVMIGRLFRNSLLQSGQKASFASITKMVRGSS